MLLNLIGLKLMALYSLNISMSVCFATTIFDGIRYPTNVSATQTELVPFAIHDLMHKKCTQKKW